MDRAQIIREYIMVMIDDQKTFDKTDIMDAVNEINHVFYSSLPVLTHNRFVSFLKEIVGDAIEVEVDENRLPTHITLH